MAIEDVRVRLRAKLETVYGSEEASYLMDRPPGGWSDLVTNQVLDAKFGQLSAELRGEMSELRGELRTEMAELSASVDKRLRQQTWISTTTLITGLTLATILTHLG